MKTYLARLLCATLTATIALGFISAARDEFAPTPSPAAYAPTLWD